MDKLKMWLQQYWYVPLGAFFVIFLLVWFVKYLGKKARQRRAAAKARRAKKAKAKSKRR